MKILISGGNGRLPREIKRQSDQFGEHEVILIPREDMDVSNYHVICSVVSKHKPDLFIHSGALTKPMSIHKDDPIQSINSNIIGTCNVTKVCMKQNIKLIYISTDYVYSGTNGGYKETDALKPVNEYGWSKLGGECAVHMYPNSLILRLSKIQHPFPHPKALNDIWRSTVYDPEAATLVLTLLDEFGIINVGGKRLTPYEFAIKDNADIQPMSRKDVKDVDMAIDSSMDIMKLTRIKDGRNKT